MNGVDHVSTNKSEPEGDGQKFIFDLVQAFFHRNFPNTNEFTGFLSLGKNP